MTLRDDESLVPGFSWEEKYPTTLDLQPSALEYNPVFSEILSASKIIEFISDILGTHVNLTHLQVGKSLPASRSYMSWHRDSYAKGRNWIGPIPPTLKLVYFPETFESKVPCLEVADGTQRSQIPFPMFDKLQHLIHNKTVLYSSPNSFMFFDSSTLHRAIPNKVKSLIRIIVIFSRTP